MTPPLPKTLAELAQWQVYADHLLERGDRLGALLSCELSLGASPSKAELGGFHRHTHRICRASDWFGAAWMLGHVRSLNVVGNPRRRLMMSRMPPQLPLAPEEFSALRQFISQDRCSRLESLTLLLDSRTLNRDWAALMSALPQSCTHVRLERFAWDDQEARRLLDAVPAHVTRLECGAQRGWNAAWSIDQRFHELDLRDVMLHLALAETLVPRLEEHPRLRVRLGWVRGRDALERLRPWAVVGAPGDAALVHEGSGGILLLPRTGLAQLQRRNGVISARAQLERLVPETFGLVSRDTLLSVSEEGDHLVRHGDGTWTARVFPESSVSMSIDGVQVEAVPMPLRPDARVELNGQPYRFVERVSGA